MRGCAGGEAVEPRSTVPSGLRAAAEGGCPHMGIPQAVSRIHVRLLFAFFLE